MEKVLSLDNGGFQKLKGALLSDIDKVFGNILSSSFLIFFSLKRKIFFD